MEKKMKKISGGEFPKSVDWSVVDELNGVISDRRVIIYDGKERKCLTLETEDGNFTIWESRGLVPLFQINEGVYVEIKNLGMKEMKKSGNKMRLFDISADEGQLEIPF